MNYCEKTLTVEKASNEPSPPVATLRALIDLEDGIIRIDTPATLLSALQALKQKQSPDR